MSTRHVAIDLGASGGRVALGTIEDGKLRVEVLHRFENAGVPLPTGLYWDAIGLWREALRGLRLAGERGIVDSVGVNSWGVDYGLIDQNDLLMDGVRHYRDARTDGLMEEVFESVSRERIYDATGIQFMQLNTLFQLAAHERQAPGILGSAKRMLMVPDLLHYWLSGNQATERTIASTSQLYDPITCDWHWNLIHDLHFPAHIFGPIVDPGSDLGSLRRELARVTNLEDTRVIAPASHDTASAVAAVPAIEGDDWAYISSGTWALVGVETSAPVMGRASLDGNLTNEAGVNGTTRLLKNIVGLWILQECRRAWGNPEYPVIYGEAEAAKSIGACIDPDDPCFLQPCDDMPERVQAFLGRTNMTRGQIARCVLESLAKKSADVLAQLEAVTGRSVRKVHIVGGGSQIPVLNQMIANACRRPVLTGPVEATLLGNLLVQAEACEAIERGTIREMVRRTEPLTAYDPKT